MLRGLIIFAFLTTVLSIAPATRSRAIRVPDGDAKEDQLAIILNTSNPAEDLSMAELRRIFLGDMGYWQNGRRITVVMLERGRPERSAVLRLIYRMREGDYERHFLQATFTGQVPSAPKVVATATSARKFVNYVAGAIGYVRADEVDETVKVIRLNGRAPGEAGYPLRLR